VKLLEHKETRSIRILLRRSQILKLACNHKVTTDIELQPLVTSEKAWCWIANDFAEGAPQIQQFAIRFKTKELAQEFKEKFEECQQRVAALPQSPKKKVNNEESQKESEDSELLTEEYVEYVTNPSDVSGNDSSVVDSSYYGVEGEDDEESPLFSKRVTLSYMDKEQKSGWKNVGTGELHVIMDEDVQAMRIQMYKDSGALLVNHIICRQHKLNPNDKKKHCEWMAKDFSANLPVEHTFRVKFVSLHGMEEFKEIFKQGLVLARESEVDEVRDI